MSPFDLARKTEIAELLGALAGVDPNAPPLPSERWREARPLIDLEEATEEEEISLVASFEAAYRASSSAIRLATAVRAARDESTIVEPSTAVLVAAPPVRRARRPFWRRLLGMAILGCVGCSGAVEPLSAPRDAGAADLAPQTGCYGDAQLACGPIVSRWCWASPSSAVPDGCVPFAPDAEVTTFGYVCC